MTTTNMLTSLPPPNRMADSDIITFPTAYTIDKLTIVLYTLKEK